MTKENFIKRWSPSHLLMLDFEDVIAHEIAKVQEQPQPELNPIAEPYETFGTLGYKKPQPDRNEIEQAYERGEKIRNKNWLKNAWIQKLSKTESTSDTLTTFSNNWDFITHPEKWELYTEPAEQPELNPIEQAYEQGLRVREKIWCETFWIKKNSETQSIDEIGRIWENGWTFETNPEKWELYTEPAEQPAHNPIAEAYERGDKIRKKHWASEDWIKKISDTESIDENGKIWVTSNDFKSIKTMPDNWELYTEPTKQTAKPFDKDRFEAMFRAVVASGVQQNFEYFKIDTTYFLQQLDAYYASKEGGKNG